jgi:hypothetical protein
MRQSGFGAQYLQDLRGKKEPTYPRTVGEFLQKIKENQNSRE